MSKKKKRIRSTQYSSLITLGLCQVEDSQGGALFVFLEEDVVEVQVEQVA